MKVVIVVALILVGAALAAQGAASITNPALEPHPGITSSFHKLETRLLEALRSISTSHAIADIDAEKDGNKLGQNSSDLGLLAPNSSLNTPGMLASVLEPPATNSSAPGSAMGVSAWNNASGEGAGLKAPEGMLSDTKGGANGFWSIQARKQGFGRSDISSRTVLSGSFEVEKRVQFAERP
jgi:hypothetical protein